MGRQLAGATPWHEGAASPGTRRGPVLTPCSSVHMYGIRFPLDVAFLDAAGTVVASYPALRPAPEPAGTGMRLMPWSSRADTGAFRHRLGDVLWWSVQHGPLCGTLRVPQRQFHERHTRHAG